MESPVCSLCRKTNGIGSLSEFVWRTAEDGCVSGAGCRWGRDIVPHSDEVSFRACCPRSVVLRSGGVWRLSEKGILTA